MLWISRQALRHKVLEEGTPLAVNGRRLLLHNVENDLALALLDVGRVPICELVGEDTCTPNIYSAIVPFLSLDQLGSHPAHSAHTARSVFSLGCKLGRVAEICQL